MRLRKIYISVYLIVTVTILIMIASMSIAVFNSIKTIRMEELCGADIEKFRYLENTIENIDDKAKSVCIAQMIDSENTAVMYSRRYEARVSVKVLENLSNTVMADSDIQSAYIYNNIIGKYIGIAMEDAEAEKNIFNEISRKYDGEIPRLTPIPRKLKRYNADESYNVISYIAYDDASTDKTPEGAVIINLNLDSIKEVATSATGQNSRIIILDKKNSVIIDTAEKGEFLSSPDKDILEMAENCISKNAPQICRIEGKKTVVNSFVMEGTGWKYINIVDYNDYFAAIHQIGRRIGIMAVLFAIIAVIAAFYIAKIITVPINNFIVKINSFAKNQSYQKPENKNRIPMPTNLLNNYFADAAADFRETFKLYAHSQSSEEIREAILFGKEGETEIKGHIIMYEIYNMQTGELYLSHVFNMVKAYIINAVDEEFDFVVLDKGRAVAIIDRPMKEISSICRQATEDAKLCGVTLSAFIGRYVSGSAKVQEEFIYCRSMARYQLAEKEGFVYDYMQYEADEKRNLKFSEEEMSTVINEIIINTEKRKHMIETYLESVADNSIENFTAICRSLIKFMQEICDKISVGQISEFKDINMAIATAETFGEIVNLAERAAEIVSEIYINNHSRRSVTCDDIREYIRQNITDQQMSALTIAEAFGVSQRKISHNFKEECGRSLAEEINVVRLSMVADMLLKTDEPIKNIMQQCGFTNESNFYKLFKKYYHVTPNEYKNM